jgi:hypothetical protein
MRHPTPLVVLALTTIALAVSPAAAWPRVGVTGGPQLTQLASRSYDLIGRPEVRWTLTGVGGVLVEMPMRGRFVLATGLEYSEHADLQHWRAAVGGSGSLVTLESDKELRQSVLSLPVRLEWQPGHWRLGAGPEVRYLLSADQRWRVVLPPVPRPNLVAGRGGTAGPAAQIFETIRPDQWQDATYLFRRWSLGAQLAVGRGVPLGSHVLRADLRWNEGITYQQWAPGAAQRSRAAQLAFGLFW